VRRWIEEPPGWVEIRHDSIAVDELLDFLDPGEAAVIALAAALRADMLLMDERKGVAVARRKGLTVTGTLGILAMASGRKLVHLADAFQRLRATNFHCSEELYRQLLDAAETGDKR
jgi:predicted nucleic acid-binding protein